MPFRVVGRISLPQRELWHVQLAVNSRCRPYFPESGIGIRSRMPNVDRIPPELEIVQCNLNGVESVDGKWNQAKKTNVRTCSSKSLCNVSMPPILQKLSASHTLLSLLL